MSRITRREFKVKEQCFEREARETRERKRIKEER
jgi:hypothetical protein